MAGPYKTRCPHCGAQFKISDEHLGQAGGAVRCGSCLRIFQATDHLIGDAPPVGDADHWDAPRQEEQPPRLGSSSDRQDGLELSDAFIDLDGGQRHDHFADLEALGDDNGDHRAAGKAGADESWAEALLRDLEDDDAPPAGATAPAAKPATKPTTTTPTTAPLYRNTAARDDDDGADHHHQDPFDFLNRNAARRRGGQEYPDYVAPPPAGPAVMLKWGILSLLALLVLGGQYAAFHFQDLARQPQWRPYYAQACELLGCVLPTASDPSKLRGANLVVRSHPRFRDALMVDALLFNEADWPQPFPALELTFTDLRGQVVATRRFQPAEYLRGELADGAAMPTGTPVHIGLEIADPGPAAVNYDLRLLPAGVAPAAPDRAS